MENTCHSIPFGEDNKEKNRELEKVQKSKF